LFDILNIINSIPRVINENKCWIPTKEGKPINLENSKSIYFGFKLSYNLPRLVTAAYHDLDLNNSKQFACHHCDIPACFNPDHLYNGNAKSNAEDRFLRIAS